MYVNEQPCWASIELWKQVVGQCEGEILTVDFIKSRFPWERSLSEGLSRLTDLRPYLWDVILVQLMEASPDRSLWNHSLGRASWTAEECRNELGTACSINSPFLLLTVGVMGWAASSSCWFPHWWTTTWNCGPISPATWSQGILSQQKMKLRQPDLVKGCRWLTCAGIRARPKRNF